MLRVAFIALILLALCTLSSGAITATLDAGPGLTPVVFESPIGSGSYNVELVRPNNTGSTATSIFSVKASSATDRIGTITVRSQESDQSVAVVVGTSQAPVASVEAIGFGNGGNDAAGGVYIYNSFISGDLGSTDVSYIQGPLTVGGSITGLTRMRAVPGFRPRITDLFVNGDLLGDVLVEHGIPNNLPGRIDSISVAGSVGTMSNPVHLQANSFGSILISGDYNATLESIVSGVPTLSIARLGVAGSLRGLVHTLFVGGPQPNYIRCDGQMAATIVIGGDFAVDSTSPPKNMQFADSKLTGRVIINAVNDPIDDVVWDAEIRVGNPSGTGFALLGLYTPTAVQLGGGSAGVIPFALHKSDCRPVEGATLAPDELSSAKQPFLRWYGPVSLAGSDAPLEVIQRKINAGSGDPENDLTSCFTFKPVDSDTLIPFNPAGSFLPVGDYVIRAATGIVKNNVLGTEVGDVRTGTDGELRFSIRWPCPGDFNNDNAVDTADLVTFLSQFGQSGPCGNNRDLDGDLAVNTADLTMFLSRFGNTCTGSRPGAPAAPVTRGVVNGSRNGTATASAPGTTESNRPGEPAPMPPVLAALGFTSIESYTTYVEGLTEQQLSAHILQLLETIQMLENQTP